MTLNPSLMGVYERKASLPSFFGRWVEASAPKPEGTEKLDAEKAGAIDELITAGTAFGTT
jgi:hypothetical protein